jgi:CO/xanthine dehydrogenase Mo-binding subunit
MCFIWERVMDGVARELALDPVAVRRRNLIAVAQFPYTPPHGNIHGSGDYQTLLDKALANVGYDQIRRSQATERKNGRLIGIGVVIGVEPGGRNAARDMAIFRSRSRCRGGRVEGATVKIEKNGGVVVTLGSPSCGQSPRNHGVADCRRDPRDRP